MTEYRPVCMDCVHFLGALRCKAFPDGIPDRWLDNPHRKVQPGQAAPVAFTPIAPADPPPLDSLAEVLAEDGI